ncbi:MAG TPA: hydantoinase/oxoprolinase family protein [Thermoplasmata archaeon]|nr:hydantoinase/oxoprolinase family protein [Thermoplasmata archaeon]
MIYRLGIDVGGTNTDAVVLDNKNNLISKAKVPTTEDVTTGILRALVDVLSSNVNPSEIKYAMLGTTHCTNAIVERKNLARVGIIRAGRPATLSVKPLISWPEDLIQAIGGNTHIVSGGHEFDGRELSPLDESEVRRAAEDLNGKGVESVAVSSVFSPVNDNHEIRIAKIVKDMFEEATPISLSHKIGSIGLLERENATILNAAVVKVAERAISSFERVLREKKIDAHLYITQNDGTLMSAEYALRYPILTIASGPANSLRGGAFLSKLKNGIVVDVGGTTTDISALLSGFPRESAVNEEIGGVRTNFRMPDLISIGLGGGSLVEVGEGIEVGPQSVGYKLTEEALIFGGKTLTATDVAVFLKRAKLGDPSRVKLDKKLAERADERIEEMIEEAIDKMKTSGELVPVILVGGGSILLPDRLKGASEIIRPLHFEVANAIGAAIAQVSGEVDRIFSMAGRKRGEILNEGKRMAIEEAVNAGADRVSVEVVDVEEIPLAYLPGNAVRIRAKAAGYLRL